MNERSYRLAEQRLWASYGIEPSEQRVRLACTGTEVRVQEVGAGTPIIFIHGGPNAGATWAPMLPYLDGYRCLLLDRPGTGLSDPYTLNVEHLRSIASRFVADVLDGLELESADVIASSFGGMLALYSAAATPNRFDRMVQMAAPAMAPGSPLPPFMRLVSMGWVRSLLDRLPRSPKATEMIMRQLGHGKSVDAGLLPAPLMEWYEKLMEHTETQASDGAIIGQVATPFGFRREYDIPWDTLGQITVPTLYVWGIEDGFGGEHVARPLVEAMPKAELVMLPDTGHLPWFDKAEDAARLSIQFLQRQHEDA